MGWLVSGTIMKTRINHYALWDAEYLCLCYLILYVTEEKMEESITLQFNVIDTVSEQIPTQFTLKFVNLAGA